MVKKTQVRTKYPKFFRDDDVLIGVGWSESQQREYVRGRIPKYVVDAVVSRILGICDSDGNFKSERIKRLRDAQFGAITDTHSALGLSWLLKEGLVKKFEPGFYFVPSRSDLLDGTEHRWERLRRPTTSRGKR